MQKILLSSNGPKGDIFKLIFISLLVTLFFLFSANTTIDSDSKLFIHYAYALAEGTQHISQGVERYDIVYPALLYLTFFTYAHSLILITLLNGLMAFLVPLIIYLTLKPTFSKGAFYISLFSIVSLAPYYYMKWIRPDHTFIFFNLLSIYFLSVFYNTKQIKFLYAMTIIVIIASLTRAAGNIFFPLFLGLAFLFGRGPLKHYAICLLIGISVFTLYSYHRHLFFDKLGEKKSFNGGQVFHNIYLNSKEMGIKLNPNDIGPAFKLINDNLHRAISPASAKSALMTQEDNISWQTFSKNYIAPFTVDQFMEQIYDHPAWDYQSMLYSYTQDDKIFLKASLEIFIKYPWYPIAYITRNMWKLLYDPGWAHSRYNINPFGRTGVDQTFPFDHTANDFNGFPEQAIKEIKFDDLKNKPIFIQKRMRHLREYYYRHYLKTVKIAFFFILIAWSAVLVKISNKFIRFEKLTYIANLLPKNMVPLIVSLSVFLLANFAIISAFVDPQLRFHNHMVLFKIMLAGIGACILVSVIFEQFKMLNRKS